MKSFEINRLSSIYQTIIIWLLRERLLVRFTFPTAGAGGAAVAGRLSEVKDWKVLLIEAGPDEPAGAEIPSNLLLYLGN